MKNIVVEICVGTNCYVMGGADLLELEDHLPEEIFSNIEIKGSPCIETCFKQDNQKPPFVKINGEVMDKASIAKIKKRLLEILN